MMQPLNDGLVVFIYVDDLERSSGFYREVLGLPLVLDQVHCRIYKVSDGGYLGICTSAERSTSPEGVIVTLVRDDVDEYCARLAAAGVVFEKAPQLYEKFDIYHAFLRDPDGYLIEIQRFNDASWNVPLQPEA